MSKHWRRDPDGNLTLHWEPLRFRVPALPLLFWLMPWSTTGSRPLTGSAAAGQLPGGTSR